MRGGLPLAGGMIAALLLGGCYQVLPIDDPDGSPPPWDAGPRPDAGPPFVPPPGKCTEPAGVDLLLVVDDSGSLGEEQASFVAELPSLVRLLVEPPDRDGDGMLDWLPIEDLQVGVVTTDMGTGGHAVPTCANADFGDDGVLRTEGRTEVGCAPTFPSFLRFEPGAGGSPEALAADLACVAQVGTGGCGFEQPLEAALKALSPARPTVYTGASYVAPEFVRRTAGHGDGANAGFVRDDTLLAVLILTDEEDCSAVDPELFNPASAVYGGTDLNLRCWAHAGEALHPVERYVAGLRALRAGREDLLAFAVIAGIPVDLAEPVSSDDGYARLLADPRMEERVDPALPSRLVPSCNVPGRGLAFPPRRLVQVAAQLGPARTTVQSICQESFAPATAAIARLVGARACTRFVDE